MIFWMYCTKSSQTMHQSRDPPCLWSLLCCVDHIWGNLACPGGGSTGIARSDQNRDWHDPGCQISRSVRIQIPDYPRICGPAWEESDSRFKIWRVQEPKIQDPCSGLHVLNVFKDLFQVSNRLKNTICDPDTSPKLRCQISGIGLTCGLVPRICSSLQLQ